MYVYIYIFTFIDQLFDYFYSIFVLLYIVGRFGRQCKEHIEKIKKIFFSRKIGFYEIQSIVKDIICKKKIITKKNDIFTIW